MGIRDRLERASEAAASLAQHSEVIASAAEHAKKIAAGAMVEAKLKNQHGEMTNSRLIGAMVRPAGTGRKLIKGALTEAVRQGQTCDALSADDHASGLTGGKNSTMGHGITLREFEAGSIGVAPSGLSVDQSGGDRGV